VLTDTQVRTAKILDKRYKLADERGLYLLVTPSGSRLWRFKYRMAGVEKLLSLASYPDTSLQKARTKRDAARTMVADGEDPSAKRRAEKNARFNTFAEVAEEWLQMRPSPIRAQWASCLGPLTASAGTEQLLLPFELRRTYSFGRVSCGVRSGQRFHSNWLNGVFPLRE
jgi:hypothetical protein